MSSVVIAGDTSGTVTLQAPAIAGSTVIDLPATSGTVITGSGGVTGVANGGTGASSLAANNVLLGNGTSAFQVVAPSTSGNVLTSNGTTWTSAAAPAAGLGIGQTWQNVASSRAFGTTYTNSTGKPIFVSASLATSQSGTISAVVAGVTIASHYFQYEPATPFVDFIVPNGSTYSVSGNKGLGMWFELR